MRGDPERVVTQTRSEDDLGQTERVSEARGSCPGWRCARGSQTRIVQSLLPGVGSTQAICTVRSESHTAYSLDFQRPLTRSGQPDCSHFWY